MKTRKAEQENNKLKVEDEEDQKKFEELFKKHN